jgi:lipopolysaccharide transport system ATP-binding protein
MSETVLKIENLSKQYRLGQVGTGTLSHDLKRWWYQLRGKENPYLKIGEENNREEIGGEYVWALKNINFEVKKGEVWGIIGKNGAGKSTLLKILSQVTLPTDGLVKIKGKIAALLEVGTGFHPELTGRENIYLNGTILGMTRHEINLKIDDIINFSGVAKYIDTPVKRYSSGMMVRLGFSVAAHLEPEILIVDEVLAVGDSEFQKKCVEKMKDVAGNGRTILFVSHNMIAINNLCKNAILLEKGMIKASGNANEIVDIYLHGEKDANLTFGIIEKNRNRHQYHKEILYITSIVLYENAKFVIEIESNKHIEDIIIIAGFMNDDHDKITYSASNDGFNLQIINIKKGENRFNITLHQQLLPGEYSTYFAILDKEGFPYDSLTYFGNVKIERFGYGNEKYFWQRPIGLINTQSKITTETL